MTVWRDVQTEAQALKQRNHWKGVRVVGLDGASILGWGDNQPVIVAVDLGTDEPLAVGYVNEYRPQAVRRWPEPLVQQHGITVIVTEDLFSYRLVAQKLNLTHQVCQFHVRRWVGKTLKELQETILKDWLFVLYEIPALLETFPPEGSKRLYAHWKQLPGRHSKLDQPRTPLEQLNDLLLSLSEHWHTDCTFQSEAAVP